MPHSKVCRPAQKFLNTRVFGKCYSTKETIRVDDVNDIPGHIAFDSASNSELVIPIIIGEKCVGLLDIDSPELSRFTQLEEKYLNEAVKLMEKYVF